MKIVQGKACTARKPKKSDGDSDTAQPSNEHTPGFNIPDHVKKPMLAATIKDRLRSIQFENAYQQTETSAVRGYLERHLDYDRLCIESENDAGKEVLNQIKNALESLGLLKGTQFRPRSWPDGHYTDDDPDII